MKRNVIIFSTTLAILSLFFFGFTNWNNINTDKAKSSNGKFLAFDQNVKRANKEIPDLYYGVDTRFAAIKKTDIDKATTIYDFLNEGEKQQIAQFNSVEIIIIKGERQTNIREYGENDHLTDAQIKLIRSAEYFSHFSIRTEFKEKSKETGRLEERFFNPHLTVVPDKQATYVNGKEALINYLKDNSKKSMSVIEGDKLGAIILHFTVSKDGIVSYVNQQMTTEYPSIDKKLIELIKNIPGKWTPAENSQGKKIDQEFAFTFGPSDGC